MQVRKFVLPIVFVAALGYGVFTLFAYIAAELVPVSISLVARIGLGALLLPGFVAALVVGLVLAVSTRFVIPKIAVVASLLAVTPIVILLIWVVITYASGKARWVEVCDIAWLSLFTYGFAAVGTKRTAG